MIKIIIKLAKYIFFIILGMVLFKNNWFPVQQLVSIKHYIYPVQKHDKKLPIANNFNQFILTPYLPKTPLFSDRNYYDVINDKKLENSYLIQIPRHYKNNIIIESQKKIIVYRVLSEDNDNNVFDDWEETNIGVYVKGASCNHTFVVSKIFEPGKIILNSGGPIAASPIFIKTLTEKLIEMPIKIIYH